MSRFPLVPMFSTLSSNFSVDLTGNLGYSFPTKKGRQIFSSSARLEKKRFCWSVFTPLKSHFLSTLPSLSYSVVRRGKKARVHQHRAQCWLVFMLLLIGMLPYSCAYLSLSSELFCRALPTPFRKQNFFFFQMRLAATYVLLLEVDTVTCSHPSVPTRVIEDEIGLLSSCAPSQGSK